MLFYFFITNLAAQGFVTRLWEKEVRNLAVQQDQKKKQRKKDHAQHIFPSKSYEKSRSIHIFELLERRSGAMAEVHSDIGGRVNTVAGTDSSRFSPDP